MVRASIKYLCARVKCSWVKKSHFDSHWRRVFLEEESCTHGIPRMRAGHPDRGRCCQRRGKSYHKENCHKYDLECWCDLRKKKIRFKNSSPNTKDQGPIVVFELAEVVSFAGIGGKAAIVPIG